MNRRQILELGAVATATFAFGGVLAGRRVAAQSPAIPTVDRLMLTNVVDNVYDVFAKGSSPKLDTIAVQRTPLAKGGTLLAEHGLAYHLESVRGSERRARPTRSSSATGTPITTGRWSRWSTRARSRAISRSTPAARTPSASASSPRRPARSTWASSTGRAWKPRA